jgi:hypothetical protein
LLLILAFRSTGHFQTVVVTPTQTAGHLQRSCVQFYNSRLIPRWNVTDTNGLIATIGDIIIGGFIGIRWFR